MPKVLNKRTDVIPPDAIYVGRPTKWDNPYKIGQSYILDKGDVTEQIFSKITREQAIKLYRLWLDHQLYLFNLNILELKDKDLVCWCAPLPCHADVLLELANTKENDAI